MSPNFWSGDVRLLPEVLGSITLAGPRKLPRSFFLVVLRKLLVEINSVIPAHIPAKERFSSVVRRVGFWILNIWLVYHVFSVFIAPAFMPPASPLLQDGQLLSARYNELMFLDHGYHFFAPDPGASTLTSFSMERPGDVPLIRRIPDIEIRPRLLYHRYFMLSENIVGFPEEFQEAVYPAYARHFGRQCNATTVAISRVLHEPSGITRIQAGGQLQDAEMFSEEPVGVYQLDEGTGPPEGFN